MEKKVINVPDFRDETEALVKRYKAKGTRISVNFRSIVKNFSHVDRYTHSIHPYPAKLITHIPYFFINNSYFLKDGDVVLDPFCGSGTVLLESILANKRAYGADANPLARLISEVKTEYIDPVIIRKNLKKILGKSRKVNNAKIPEIRNSTLWYTKKVLVELSILKSVIDRLTDDTIRKFFMLNLSNISRKLSLADPRISVPVRLNSDRFSKGSKYYDKIESKVAELEKVDVFTKFEICVKENLLRISRLHGIKNTAKIIATDARNLTKSLNSKLKLKSNSVSLIVTSPPYAGAQKYIRASSLNLGWLGMGSSEELRVLNKQNIGREDISDSECQMFYTGIKSADKIISILLKRGKKDRAKVVASYLNEMKKALDESIRVLKLGGHLVLVIGNNTVDGIKFKTHEYLSKYLLENGLSLELKLIDNIKSYGLMTKRNKTADIISLEWILVFKK
jgi:hypothetical protein